MCQIPKSPRSPSWDMNSKIFAVTITDSGFIQMHIVYSVASLEQVYKCACICLVCKGRNWACSGSILLLVMFMFNLFDIEKPFKYRIPFKRKMHPEQFAY